MAHLVLVEGLPGSGKSTFAKLAYPNYHHLETDKLFDRNGVYIFEPRMLGPYHKAVQAETSQLLQHGENVVVSNTFSRKWEMQPYLNMAYDTVTIYSVTTDLTFKELAARNIHGVPEEVIAQMATRWEEKDGCIQVRMGNCIQVRMGNVC